MMNDIYKEIFAGNLNISINRLVGGGYFLFYASSPESGAT
jgi:hypothetical protein